MEDKKKIIIICGPTASGKTGLSLRLAQKFNAEIISADSMQVYKGLNVGTAKVSVEEQSIVKHHLVDILKPDQPYNVQLFTEMANDCIQQTKDKNIVIAGGTGLYIQSLINGVDFASQTDNTQIKKELQTLLEEKGKEYLYNLLQEIDPEYAKTVHINNTVRVIRAIELYKLTGKTMSYQLQNSIPKEKPYKTLLIGLNFSTREKLYSNINKRVDLMMNDGLLEEAKFVFDNKDKFKNSAAAIGYKEFFDYFEGSATLEDCIEKLKQYSRNYAKRQLTWFKKMPDVNWLYVDEDDYLNLAENLCKDFLKNEV